MQFQLTDEQKVFEESMRRFVADHYESVFNEKSTQTFSMARWKALADLGCLSAAQPQSSNDEGIVELAIMAQALGRGLCPEPFLSSAVLGTAMVAGRRRNETPHPLLDFLASGDCILAVAHAESSGGNWDGEVTASARTLANGYAISGAKVLVLGGGAATHFIVSARTESQSYRPGLSLFVVPRETFGLSVHTFPLADKSTGSSVVLDNVEIPADCVIGNAGDAPHIISAALQRATLAWTAETVGIIEKVMELTIEYVRGRKQFGSPIGTYQALRHKIADMAIDQEMACSTLLKCIASFQDPANHPPASTTWLARATVGELGRRVCRTAIQLHGGMGITDECGLGRHYARINIGESVIGQRYEALDRYTTHLFSGGPSQARKPA